MSRKNKTLPETVMGGDANARELDQRLMEEINVLRLEGALFCFDPREAKRRRGTVTLTDAFEHEVSILVHPEFGQPSVLAYKVLQAIFLKLAEQGCTPTEDGRCFYNDRVSFSQRELASLAGRSSWGGSSSKQVHQAIMQLRSTQINASLYNKDNGTWSLINFQLIPTAYFAGRGDTITQCAVRLAPEIISSINRRHVVFFNLCRLNQLDTLGLVLYKRVFFHLSNLTNDAKHKGNLKFTKDYSAICREWLGGLKPLRYKSDIEKDQLGRHLDALKATGLISRHALEKNAAGTGFNLTFYPGKGFFEDYQLYYHGRGKPQRIAQAAELEEIKALELVAHFHQLLGHTRKIYKDHETAYAEELLRDHSETEVRDLIGYGVAEARKTKFEMLYFGGLKPYIEAWSSDRARRQERERRAATVKNCPLCNEAGYLELRTQATGQIVVHLCPHQPETVEQLEEQLQASRL